MDRSARARYHESMQVATRGDGREVRGEPELGGWRRALTNVTREHGFVPLRVEGRLPEGLRGTLYRNGPGLFELFGHRYRHWFDGDGLIAAVRFDERGAHGAVRLLETAGLMEERRRGKAYFGTYGTPGPGPFSPVRMFRTMKGSGKNPANTSVLAWNERLFALCEAGKPFELDAELTSIGQTDFGGVIPRTFSAHPHRVASNGFIYNIGQQVGRPALLDVFVMRPDGSAGRVVSLPLDFSTLIHDFAVTPRALVVFVAPLRLAILRALFGLGSFAENLRWEGDRGTEVIVIPLDAPASPIRFRVPAFWAWHVGNAFEEHGELVMDIVRYPDFPTTNDWLGAMVGEAGPHRDGGGGRLGRARIDPKRRTLQLEPIDERTGEFPRVAPSVEAGPNRLVYWAEHSSAEVRCESLPDTIARVDMTSGRRDAFVFPRGHWPSEGVFVPRPGAHGEREGWIVSLVYDAGSHTSHWAVLDAERLSDGPIARAFLDHHVPLGFHGTWVPAR